MLNLPRTVIAPDTTPDKPELTGGPFEVSVPILASGDDRLVVQVPPVWDVEPNRAEPHGRVRLLRDHAARRKVQYRCSGVTRRDQGELPTALAERFKGMQQTVIPLVLAHLFRLAPSVGASED